MVFVGQFGLRFQFLLWFSISRHFLDFLVGPKIKLKNDFSYKMNGENYLSNATKTRSSQKFMKRLFQIELENAKKWKEEGKEEQFTTIRLKNSNKKFCGFQRLSKTFLHWIEFIFWRNDLKPFIHSSIFWPEFKFYFRRKMH